MDQTRNRDQTPQLHHRREEAQLKHFCAMGQLAKLPGCREQPTLPLCFAARLLRWMMRMHQQHPKWFLPGSGMVAQDCRDVVYMAGRAAKSFFGVGTVCVVPALPSAGKVQCVHRARRNRYYPAQTRVHPNEGGGADGHTAL